MVGARFSAAEPARLPTQVWVPDVKEGYIPGWVHSENEEAAEVVTKGGEVVCSVKLGNYMFNERAD
jgi:hypothetical protein